ncbi:MAG: iron complex transport system permease protein [Crocinitomicaceae bacterium]
MLLLALIALPLLGFLHFISGPTSLDFGDFFNGLFNYDSNIKEHVVVREIRITRMTMAIIAGAGLSIAGLLMQTLFKNPMAGPYVLGINSGASLFVAFSIMTGIPFLTSDIGIIANALLGALIFGLIISIFSGLVRSQISLLLIGLMLGSFTSAFVSMLQAVSDAQELKVFTLWALGSLSRVEFNQLPIILSVFASGLIGSLLLVKPLNLLVLGQDQARLLGMNYRVVRLLIITITAILTGLITAFCGPIAFVGLAVPNLVRMLMKTQHHGLLILSCAVIGAIFVLICDICIQLLENQVNIPINVFTSVIGAPIVVLLILRKLR